MKEMIGVVCTVAACSTMFLLSYHLMKQRDEIRELTNKYEEQKLNNLKENLKEEEEELKKKKKPVIICDNELFSGSYIKSFELRSELADEIVVLRNSCFQNPNDIQLLRRCALTLIKMTHLYGNSSTCPEVPEMMLKEAIPKLNRVLEADQDDHEAIFGLGLAHYYLPKFDFFLDVEKHVSSWINALECFIKVGDKVPESFKGSDILEHLQYSVCGRASAVENLKWWTTGDMDNEELLEDHMYDLRREKAEDFCAECPLRNPELSSLSKASPMVLNEMGHVAVLSEERSRRNAQFQTSHFNLRSPKEINSQHKNYNPRRFLSVECPMRIGAQKLGIPAAAIQIRGMRGTRLFGSAAPILRLLLRQLISRKLGTYMPKY